MRLQTFFKSRRATRFWGAAYNLVFEGSSIECDDDDDGVDNDGDKTPQQEGKLLLFFTCDCCLFWNTLFGLTNNACTNGTDGNDNKQNGDMFKICIKIQMEVIEVMLCRWQVFILFW